MSFAHPWVLALLLVLIPLGIGLGWNSRRLQRRHAGTGAGLPGQTTVSAWASRLRAMLLLAGASALIIALSGPRWGAIEEDRQLSGIDLLIAIDCSRSMLAEDLFPDRSRAARDKAIDLVRELGEARIALLPFAAIPTLRCPLTADQIALARMLDDCTPDLFPASAGLQGTAIGQAIQEGIEILGRDAGRGQAILVISDGVDSDSQAVTRAGDLAVQAGIPVYGLFLGDDSRSARITVDGREVDVAADRDTLDTLARRTSAICVNATTTTEDIRALADHLLDHLVHAPWEERRRQVQSERYRWPLVPAIVLLGIGFLMPTASRRRT